MIRPLLINACVYCGRKAQGHYLIERDGLLANEDAPNVPLCDDCGGYPEPSTQAIWARISMRDDHGAEWGPTIDTCEAESA